MKIRIGVSAGGQGLGPDGDVALGRAVSEFGFDSLWLPEVLSVARGRTHWSDWPGLSGACPGLKVGTTMLLPGRNLVWLAKAVATLDFLSGGRFLLTFVPGPSIGGNAVPSALPRLIERPLMDEALPVLRRLWSGESVTHEGRVRLVHRRRPFTPPGPRSLRRVAGRQRAGCRRSMRPLR